MTESDYLYCALQLLLDKEERLAGLCPACRAAATEDTSRCAVCGGPLETATENPAFDLARFEELRDHGGGA
jgi:predicted amidophosphoribosyltransferase